MGFLREKYTKEYFLNYDCHGNKLNYGALGGKEFLNGEIYYDIQDSLELIDNISEKNILEIGFGRGESIKYFYNHNAHSYYGIDFSPASIEIAEEYIMPNIKNDSYEIHCDDALLHIKKNFKKIKQRNINCIIMLDVIEHIPNKELNQLLKLFDKLVENGCLFLVHTPFYEVDEDFCKTKKYLNPSTSDLIPETSGMHCNKFTAKRFYKTLSKHDFFICKSDKLFVKKQTNRLKKNFQMIFSVKNSENRSHKVFTILGIKVKFKIKNKNN